MITPYHFHLIVFCFWIINFCIALGSFQLFSLCRKFFNESSNGSFSESLCSLLRFVSFDSILLFTGSISLAVLSRVFRGKCFFDSFLNDTHKVINCFIEVSLQGSIRGLICSSNKRLTVLSSFQASVLQAKVFDQVFIHVVCKILPDASQR